MSDPHPLPMINNETSSFLIQAPGLDQGSKKVFPHKMLMLSLIWNAMIISWTPWLPQNNSKTVTRPHQASHVLHQCLSISPQPASAPLHRTSPCSTGWSRCICRHSRSLLPRTSLRYATDSFLKKKFREFQHVIKSKHDKSCDTGGFGNKNLLQRVHQATHCTNGSKATT